MFIESFASHVPELNEGTRVPRKQLFGEVGVPLRRVVPWETLNGSQVAEAVGLHGSLGFNLKTLALGVKRA